MINQIWNRFRTLVRAELFSPKDFVCRAIFILVAFTLVHLLGLREFTSILNGTTGSVDMNWGHAAYLGIIYVILYLGAVLVAPILLIAAGITFCWQHLMNHKKSNSHEP
jgi:hypothetical protein